MADGPSPLAVATAWRPQRPGAQRARDIVDALVEPDWGGLRVAVALTADEAVLLRDGHEVSVPHELQAALVAAFSAVDAVIEGHLTPKPLMGETDAPPALPKVERPPMLIPRGLLGRAKDDPFIRARDHEQREAVQASRVPDALEQGERHAFVATDLLWVDGTPLDEIPLLERKRWLDGVLQPSFLVRVTPYVKPTAVLTLVTWGQLGFAELSYRAANSRYRAGAENPDWAVAPPPQGPQAPSKGPVSKG